jgi:hypothetical protein
MSFAEFQAQYPSTAPADRVALINSAKTSDRLAAGRVMKRIVGGAAVR